MLRWRAPRQDDAGDRATRTSTLTVRPAPERANPAERLLASLADELTRSRDGVEFIYGALDRIRVDMAAEDAAVVVDEPPLGRQVFRAGRRHLDGPWSEGLVRDGAVGLHLQPAAAERSVAERVTRLCQLAVRLDAARYDAQHDALTGLHNRRSFQEMLKAIAARAERHGSTFSLVMLDIDGFKVVNDRLGHRAGDRVLRTLGTELHHRLRAGDVAARIGGDEFALILPDSDADVIDLLVARVEQALATQLVDLSVRVSAGSATAPTDGTDPLALYEIADRRLYAAKKGES